MNSEISSSLNKGSFYTERLEPLLTKLSLKLDLSLLWSGRDRYCRQTSVHESSITKVLDGPSEGITGENRCRIDVHGQSKSGPGSQFKTQKS